MRLSRDKANKSQAEKEHKESREKEITATTVKPRQKSRNKPDCRSW